MVSQHLVVVRRRDAGREPARDDPPRHRRRVRARRARARGRDAARAPREVLLARGGRRRDPLHRERDERAAPLGRGEPHAVREGRLPRGGRPRPARGRVDDGRHEGRRGVLSHPRAGPAAPPSPPLLRTGARRRRVPRSRRDLRPAHPRGRRVLRGHHARRTRRGRAPGLPPVDRGPALEQAVLRVRRRALAPRRSRAARAAARALDGQKPPVAAPLQQRGALDARQVGVSLVRRVGPRVPLHPPGARRPRVRQAAAHAARARVVHAPERADPGVRVAARRREPAGARVGRVPRLPDSSGGPPGAPTAPSSSRSSSS